MAAITEDRFAADLRAVGETLGRPAAVLILSAHGLSPAGRVTINAAEKPGLLYDFGGFPEELHRFSYAPPGSPALARRAAGLLAPLGLEVALDEDGRLDHGVWVPLSRLFPGADVPVVQVSMPFPTTPENVLAMGRALAPLREEGVLLVGSGGAVHNLRALGGATAPWALEFHRWVKDRVERKATGDLANYETLAPRARMAHPSPDHFLPIFFPLGAAGAADRPQTLIDDIQLGSLSLYAFALTA